MKCCAMFKWCPNKEQVCVTVITSWGITDLDTLLEHNCFFSSLPVQEPMLSRVHSSSEICTCEALYNSSKVLVSWRCPWTESWNVDSSEKWQNTSAPKIQVVDYQ